MKLIHGGRASEKQLERDKEMKLGKESVNHLSETINLPTSTLTVTPDSPVFTGETVNLKCKIKPDHSDWRYEWYKGSTKVSEHHTVNRDTFTIRGVKKSDAGQYTCKGQRDGKPNSSQSSSAVSLSVTERPKPVVKVTPDQRVFRGETVTLTCDIQGGGNIQWTYSWFKDGSVIRHVTERVYTISHLCLIVVNTAVEERDQTHRDQTSVVVGGLQLSFTRSFILLSMETLPTSTLTVTPDSPVFTGETVNLKCVIESHSNWRYEWYKGSTEVSEHYTVNGNTLTIVQSKTSDEGLKPKPELTSDPAGAALTGNTVTLICRMDPSTGWDFYWYKHTLNSETKKTETNSYRLKIDSVSDGGQYWCRAGRGKPVYYTQYSDALWVNVTVTPKAVVTVRPDERVFRGETVTLRCDIKWGGDTEWTYRWEIEGTNYQHKNSVSRISTQEWNISSVNHVHSGKYTCTGQMDKQSSQRSDAVTLNVSAEAQAAVRVSPQPWLTEGDSVTLICEVTGSSTGWTFSWFRDDDHLSDSSRGAGGSYTLSPAALQHTGVYTCRAERGRPAYYTNYSNTQPLWIIGVSRSVSLVVSPSRSQHFSSDSLSLSCEDQSNSAGWTVRRYTDRNTEDCIKQTGSTCRIVSLSTSDTGVYWCQSESGEKRHPLNITVHADFYKDGSLIQNQTTGEMNITTVSKSHEGFYYCKTERGQSLHSWISVRVSAASLSPLLVTGVVVGLSVSLLIFISLVLLWRYKKNKGADAGDATYAQPIRKKNKTHVTLTLSHTDCCTTPRTTFPISHCTSPASNQRHYLSPGLPAATCRNTRPTRIQQLRSCALNKGFPNPTAPQCHFINPIGQYTDIALQIFGSSLTVGVEGKQRDIAVTPAVQPTRVMAAVPVRAHKMAATAEPVHKMAAKAELRHVTAAIQEPFKVTATFPESSQVSKPSQATAVVPVSSQTTVLVPVSSQVKAVFPVSSQVRAIAPISSQVTAIFPEPSTVKMAVTPEPLHKMAATPEPLHKMAATPEPLHKMAAVSKPLHKMAAVSKPLHKMAAVSKPLHKMAAIPPCRGGYPRVKSRRRVKSRHSCRSPRVKPSHGCSPRVKSRHDCSPRVKSQPSQASAAAPESSQATAVASKSSQASKSSNVKAVVPASSNVKAVVPESSNVIAVVPESSKVNDLHKPIQVTAGLHVSDQSPVTSPPDGPESRHVPPDGPESRHVPPNGPESCHVPLDGPESSHASSDRPEPCHIRFTNARSPFSVCGPHTTLQRSRLFTSPPGVTSGHKSAPEITSGLKLAPEVPSGLKSAPEVPSGPKSAPEVPSGLKFSPEVPSGLKSAPEAPSDHESAPEAFPVGEAAPMPPEVSASAVDPPREAAFILKHSASPLILSASSVPVLPRSQPITWVPAPPWRPPAPPAGPPTPPAPPWRAPAPPAPAPPWRAPAPPAPALPWRAPAPPAPAPPWRAPAPPAPPWRAPAPLAPPPAPPWRALAPPAPPWRAPAAPAPPWSASSLPVLPQSPGPPTAAQDCFAVGASGSLSLGGYVTNLVTVLRSAHHQMSLLPYHTRTVALHPGLHSPSAIARHPRPIRDTI
ncbi:Fc receptor-like protein 5 [Labeo rohita]|uniref:Fc receptor-like protein 5 n=1 Tax=Labeo rohita TaxID=84645 RepID=A0ABQ8LAZ2_LABRO|nr:Fc receptor-like protein 5 [Labeo rohita]